MSNTPTPHTHIGRKQGRRLTKQEREQAQSTFLEAFAESANVRSSCQMVGIDRSTFYQWLEHDESFTLAFRQAELEANDTIRAELFRRAVQGVEEPVVSMGSLVYHQGKPLTVKKYSDSLLALLAKARMPEFRDKSSVDVNASIHGTVQHIRKLHALSDEELDLLEQLAAKAQEG